MSVFSYFYFKATPEGSMSSADWPSILNVEELKGKTAENPYKDIGKRPRHPLPFEANKETEDSSDASSIRHQHTHHHYHHYTAQPPTKSHPKLPTSALGRVSPPKSSKTSWHDGTSAEGKGKRPLREEKATSKNFIQHDRNENTKLDISMRSKCHML